MTPSDWAYPARTIRSSMSSSASGETARWSSMPITLPSMSGRRMSLGNLGFSFLDYGCEHDLLAVETGNSQSDLKANVISLHEQGCTQQQIADRLQISQSKVSRILKSRMS